MEAQREAASVRESDVKAAEMERLAQQALLRVKGSKRPVSVARRPRPVPREDAPILYSSRSFLAVWSELQEWWLRYDVEQMARELADEDVEMFRRVVDGTTRFAGELQAARTAIAA